MRVQVSPPALLKMIPKILTILVAVALLFLYLRYIENRTLFYPDKNLEVSPKDIGLAYDAVIFQTTDNKKISAWFISAPSARYTILFCHGNAGNISHRIEKLKFFHDLQCSVLIFDYRGYGRSGGRPSEQGLYQDAQTAYEYLLMRKIPTDKIVVYGESIGGAVAIELAAKNKIEGLILESTFSNVKDMVQKTFPLLPYWILSSRFDSLAKIRSITVPKLIIHSINDEIVPYELGEKLFEAAALPKEMATVHGGHNSCFYESNALFREKISAFLANLPK